MSENHKAIVARVRVSPIEGAKTLALGNVLGFQILVGKDTVDNELGVFFNKGLQLSEEFAKANDLVRRKDPVTGEKAGGMFDENRKVRCQKFFERRSEGFWCPLSYFEFTGYNVSKLQEGEFIDVLNDVPICNKFYTKQTKIQGERKEKRNRGETRYFPKHFDTKQFRYYADQIPKGSILSITTKLHGTSQRYGYVLEDLPLKWYHKFLYKFGFPVKTQEYEYLNGTRNVICVEDKEGYHSTYLRKAVVEQLYGKLHKGEIVFFEVVGYDKEGPIMGTVKPKGELKKKWGDGVVYNYGCRPGEFDIYVYRIAYVTANGQLIDLPWDAVKLRSNSLGVKHVPEEVAPFVYDGDVDKLRELVETLTEADDPNFPFHPKEGVCVRSDDVFNLRIFKSKSFVFKVLEGIIKDDENYQDVEEIN